MVFCWASSIGGCDGGPSREHIISEGILSLFSGVGVHGFPWCRDAPKTVGPSSLTSHVLCERHNSELSSTDAAAITLFTILRNHHDPATPCYPHPVSLDGFALERWLLKSSISVSLQESEPPAWPKPWGKVPVPRELALVAFDASRLCLRRGLYWRGIVGQSFVSEDRLDITPCVGRDGSVGGFRWAFRGLQLYLWLHPTDTLVEVFPRHTVIAGETGSSLIYRPNGMTLRRPPALFCEFRFLWGVGAPNNEMQQTAENRGG